MKANLKYIRKAADIASKVIDETIEMISPGMTENEVASLIRKLLKQNGADRESFRIIVASGKRTALPHGYATSKKISPSDVVMIDMGAKYRGNCSDITRTFFMKEPDKQQKKIYDLVEKAQEIAIAKVKAGVPVRDIDKKVRDYFKMNRVEKYFPHSTGHGIGLKVHENPRISIKNDNDKLTTGTVITIEPGLYFNGKFGIRIEDMLLVTDNGYEILT